MIIINKIAFFNIVLFALQHVGDNWTSNEQDYARHKQVLAVLEIFFQTVFSVII